MSSSADTQPAMTYPTNAQYERWKEQAEELDMSVSEFMQAMVEAGMKKFDTNVTPDETNSELREQRNDLKIELEHARDRISTLEERLHRGERTTIEQYIQGHPGATFEEVVQHVVDTVPERVAHYLDDLEGDSLRVRDGEYYVADGESET